MKKFTVVRRAAGVAAVSGIAAVAGILGASPAHADGAYTGKVTANGGIAIRTAPTTHSGTAGSLAQGRTFSIDCKVWGTSVGGNRYWYALSGNKGWVSARYVANVGAAPKFCPAFDTEYGTGKTTTTLNMRQGPSTSDAPVGLLQTGRQITVKCYAMSQSIYGNRMWYQLDSGQWVAAAHVQRVPVVPSNWPPCAE